VGPLRERGRERRGKSEEIEEREVSGAYFSSESGDISDILLQFPMSSSSRVPLTGRSLLTSVMYIQLFTFSCFRCCSPTETKTRNCLGLPCSLVSGNTVRLFNRSLKGCWKSQNTLLV